MPRAPSGKQKEGEALFRKGMKLSEIAKELGVAEGTVRLQCDKGIPEGLWVQLCDISSEREPAAEKRQGKK